MENLLSQEILHSARQTVINKMRLKLDKDMQKLLSQKSKVSDKTLASQKNAMSPLGNLSKQSSASRVGTYGNDTSGLSSINADSFLTKDHQIHQ